MLNTKVWTLTGNADTDIIFIQEAAEILRNGGIVAFPTETVYGLGADATSAEAVEGIFKAKGRPSDNPLIVHIADFAQLDGIVREIPPLAQACMERFWPGPLTVVLPVRVNAVSSRVTAGLDTVAVRMPDHPVARRLIRLSGLPIAAPSANLSGRPSATAARHVIDDFKGRIDGILDGGSAQVGLESTVMEVRGERITILRPGGVTLGQLREMSREVEMDPHLLMTGEKREADRFVPRSPGMKYTHYAPRGELVVVQGSPAEKVTEWIQRQLDDASSRGHKTGVLTTRDFAAKYRADVVIPCGGLNDRDQTAKHLYAALREFDAQNVTFILTDILPRMEDTTGMGFAVMNRLLKAAGGRVVTL